MLKTLCLTVTLSLTLAVCAWSQGGRFHEIFLGEPTSALLFPCAGFLSDINCDGKYQSSWVRIDVSNQKVSGIEVCYVERRVLSKKISVWPTPTLAQAIKIHSLQVGFAPPKFAYAKDRDGVVYGFVDLANRVVYDVAGGPVVGELAFDSLGPVGRVSYLKEDAPVLRWADALPDNDNAELLGAAEKADPYVGTLTVLDKHADLTASSRDGALEKLNAQIDVVAGKGRRTLALIQDLQSWYEIDKNHPNAQVESKELREFYPAFQEEYDMMTQIAALNERFWKGSGTPESEAIKLEAEPYLLREKIESQMRRLMAMGFEP